MADRSTSLMQCVAKDGQEDNRGDNTLEGEESQTVQHQEDKVHLPEPDNGKDAAGQHHEVAEVVAKGHASENREGSVQLFTIRHSPRICHPIRHIGAPIPGSLRRWDWVEIRIGKVLGLCKRALFLLNFEAEVESESSPHRADMPRFRVGSDPEAILRVRAV
ncbi:hypothetical protein HG530_014603 [Fusarium avenaceum]|nr:hypothetical protein HG530_014603 [Fusarium avenaceum]